jgi:aspartate aminotransferase
MQISRLANSVPESDTLRIDTKAKALIKSGVDVINFGVGEPDFQPHPAIRAKTIEAATKGVTKYTPVAGTLELRQAIANKLEKDNSLVYTPQQIIVSSGAKQSLYNSMAAILNPGDEVLILSPHWVSYPEQVKLVGAVPIFVATDKNFLPDLDKIAGAITPKTRMLIINSPTNPTGAVYSEPILRSIADLAVNRNLTVLSDEIYEKIIYGQRHVSIASFNEQIKEQTVTINGPSKSHSMTGYRIGYAAGPSNVIAAMVRIQSQTTSGPSSVSQHAALAAYSLADGEMERSRLTFQYRRDQVVEGLLSIPGVKVVEPQGAFYVLADISAAYRRSQIFPTTPISSLSGSFADALLDKAHVAVVAGAAFGSDNHIRISYALSEDKIAEGVKRIRGVLR